MEAIAKSLRGAAHRQLGAFVALSLAAAATQFASAEITQYTDQAAWNAAAGAVTTIGVPNVLAGPLIDQTFLGSGLTVTGLSGGPAPDWVAANWGLPPGTNTFRNGSWVTTRYRFASPVQSFALNWLLTAPTFVHLFMDNVFVGIEWQWQPQNWGSLSPSFYGFTSTVAFNRIDTASAFDTVHYGHSIHFPQIVPAPAAGLVLLGLMPFASRRRR